MRVTDQAGDFEHALVARFGDCHVTEGGEVWVQYRDALNAVAMAEERGLHILGMEGLLVGPSGVYPAMSRIADWSGTTAAQSHVFARELLTGPWATPPDDVHSEAAGDYMIDLVV